MTIGRFQFLRKEVVVLKLQRIGRKEVMPILISGCEFDTQDEEVKMNKVIALSFALFLAAGLSFAALNTVPVELTPKQASSELTREEWVRPAEGSRLQEWITYYSGSPAWVTWQQPMRATWFVPPDFANCQYPFWIKKIKNIFYEHPDHPWDSEYFYFMVLGDNGADTLYLSPQLLAQRYPMETEHDMGADSVEITAGNFYLAVDPEGAGHPSCLADAAYQGRSRYGQPGGWAPWAMGEFAKYAYVRWYEVAHDVRTLSIDAPGAGVWVDTSYGVQATVENTGQNTETFDVECIILDSGASPVYGDTQNVASLNPGVQAPVSFANWTPTIYDETHSVRVVTLLGGDENPANDTLSRDTQSYEEGEIAYDDFSAESYWVVNSPNGPTDAFVARFTPYIAPPFHVSKWKIYVNSNQAFDNVRLCPDAGGVPDWNNPYQVFSAPSASSPPNWIIMNFDTNATWMGTSADLWLGAQFANGQSGPGIGMDEAFPVDWRSFWSNDFVVWNPVADGDWMMRIVHAPSTGVAEVPSSPTAPSFQLSQNWPNPVVTRTAISYQLPAQSAISLKVYDLSGRMVRSLVEETKEAGIHTALWDRRDDQGRDVASGVYFYKLTTNDLAAARKLVVLR